MTFINRMSRSLKPSETLAIKARAAELKAQGRTVIDLSAGEPDFDTPEFIKQGAREALQQGKTRYTSAAGIIELRQAIAEKLRAENGLDNAEAGSIIVTNGGKQALHEFFAVVIEPGDEVIIPAPYWVSYPAMVEIPGGKVVVAKTGPETGYKISAAQLSALISKRTKCVIINSPSNPTGAGYSAAEMRELGKVIAETQALVCSDEVYEKITYSGFEFVSFAKAVPELSERTLTVGAFSKTYSMTGWRVGYASGPAPIISAMVNFQSQTTSNINSIAQYAALAALRGPQDFLPPVVAAFERRMEQALEVLQDTPGLYVAVRPVGAFYLFVRFERLKAALARRHISGSAGLVNYLVDTAGVAVVPGEAFGDDEAFRVSLACSDQAVQEGLLKIREAVQKL